MKKTTILIFTLFVNIYVYSQKAIPKSVSDDFTYSVFENYKYGNGNIKMLLMTKLRQQGYSPMNVDVLMETIDKNVKNRNKVIEAIHSVIGDNEEFMYANLSSLGMSATNAKYMTEYILNEDYKVQPTEKELEEIKNKKLNEFNLEKEKRKNEFNNLMESVPADLIMLKLPDSIFISLFSAPTAKSFKACSNTVNFIPVGISS